jgi:hypothetical protein
MVSLIARTWAAKALGLSCMAATMTDRLFEELSESSWPRLKILVLIANPISNRGIKALSKMDLPDLVSLVMAKLDLTSDACQLLSKRCGKPLNQLSVKGLLGVHVGSLIKTILM